LYTGRGPVCGMITRGGAGIGGLEAAACNCADCAGGWGAGLAATGACPTGIAGRGGIATAAGGAALTGGVGGGAGGRGVTIAAGGRDAATEAGVTNLGAGVSAAGFAGAAGLTVGEAELGSGRGDAVATGAAGFTAAGRAAGSVAVSVFCSMARITSPGREMFDKSIFVLNSSSERAEREALDGVEDSSPFDWKYLRTSTASCSSIELECVFFSVTPTAVRASRIALLFTSNSRARSLIRILLIHPLAFRFPLSSHMTSGSKSF
jgi:hypothetical protein